MMSETYYGAGGPERKKRSGGGGGNICAQSTNTDTSLNAQQTYTRHGQENERRKITLPPGSLKNKNAQSLDVSLVTEMRLLLYQLNPHHPVIRRQQDLVTKGRVRSVIRIGLWAVLRCIVTLYGTERWPSVRRRGCDVRVVGILGLLVRAIAARLTHPVRRRRWCVRKQ